MKYPHSLPKSWRKTSISKAGRRSYPHRTKATQKNLCGYTPSYTESVCLVTPNFLFS